MTRARAPVKLILFAFYNFQRRSLKGLLSWVHTRGGELQLLTFYQAGIMRAFFPLSFYAKNKSPLELSFWTTVSHFWKLLCGVQVECEETIRGPIRVISSIALRLENANDNNASRPMRMLGQHIFRQAYLNTSRSQWKQEVVITRMPPGPSECKETRWKSYARERPCK